MEVEKREITNINLTRKEVEDLILESLLEKQAITAGDITIGVLVDDDDECIGFHVASIVDITAVVKEKD